MPTTQWSLIARLKSPDSQQAITALDTLCRTYHYPLYCHIRRRGHSHHDAEDILHDFLSKLLRNDSFGLADADRGRLRSYLLTALQRFIATWHRSQQPRLHHEVSTETLTALANVQNRFDLDEAAHRESPDLLFDRQWGIELMNQVMHQLQQDYAAKGQAALFTTLQPVLLSGGSLADHDSAALASHLGLSPGALRTALHRLLQKYGQALRHQILQTVQNAEQAQTEFAFLTDCFRRS